ncbi:MULTISPECIES: hypothetical protein [unclassified Afipia]|uniref:hypothetical protein n=1 Tax=unclassified Afipia TaxID=2642050 RepID=UPI0004A2E8D1|nr:MULTISPECIES: hypothetical protein [unclassified Afipia]
MPITEGELERALILRAYFIEQDGPVYVPLFEKLEKELADKRRDKAVLNRARKLRETYTIEAKTPIPEPYVK